MSLSELDLSGNYTYADYLTWAFQERLELIKGRIFLMSPAPTVPHQVIVGNVFFALKRFTNGSACTVYVSPCDVRLERKVNDAEITTVVQPDVFVVCDPAKIDIRGCLGSPDIVIEVLSKGDNKKEIRNKFEVYEEAQVREYWIIAPSEQLLHVYRLDDGGKFVAEPLLTSGDVLQTPVLPGLRLDVDSIFGDEHTRSMAG